MTRPTATRISVRILIAGLAGTIAGIHLDLWASYGYRHIPTIGALFILNGVAGTLLALASLTAPRHILRLAWLATSTYAAATLAALLISLNGKLFGFTETTSAPLLGPSIAIEIAAVLTCFAATIASQRTQVARDPTGGSV